VEIFIVIYACEQCRFVFHRISDVEVCPACDKPFVREATSQEKNEFNREQEKNKKMKNETGREK